MSDKCIVHGCPNRKHQGSFIGDICAPCSNMLVFGDPKFGVTFVHKMRDRLEELETNMRLLFELLDRIEESDEGRVFRPVQIYCCREHDRLKLEEVLAQLKNMIEDSWGLEEKEEFLEVGWGSIVKARRENTNE